MAEDQQIDQLLRAALRSRDSRTAPDVVTDACLDAETLAAWSAQALSASEAAKVELHLSNCTRCQEIAAVFARTEPVPAEVLTFSRRWTYRWVGPLAAAAAAVLVWFIWSPTRPAPQQKQETLARAERDTPVAVPPVASPPTAASEDRAAPRELEKRDTSRNRLAAERQGRSGDLRDAQSKPSERTFGSDPKSAVAPAAAPPPAAAATPIALPPPPGAPPPPQAQGGQARSDATAFRSAELAIADARVVLEFSSADPARALAGRGGAAGAGGGGGRGARTSTLGAVQQSPAPALPRWRVLASGALQRSTDAGVSWTTVTIDPPVHVVGGASPSPTTCWLIGRGGVVLLATDGFQFERVSSPAATELSSIRATSEREAVVTAADGRVFVTTDGGASWRLQGFPSSSF